MTVINIVKPFVIRRLNTYFFIFFIFFTLPLCYLQAYQVLFEGIEDPKLMKLVQESSRLEAMNDSPALTNLRLKRRIEADILNITKVLHSNAYYDSKVTFKISDDRSFITIHVDLGPIFPLSIFEIRYFQEGKEISNDLLRCPITLEEIGIKRCQAALPDTILSAEDTLLDRLNLQGYAFASIIKRGVFVDEKEKNVIVIITVDTGPLAVFGPLSIDGLDRVHRSFIHKKLRWREGDIYDPKKIEKTQEVLELSTLFRSVSFAKEEQPLNQNRVPIDLTVIEGKQRSIGAGMSYNTELGFGVSGEWENRNLWGRGHKLSTRAEIWQKLQDGRIAYIIPDYLRQDQNLVWIVDYHHDYNKSFTEEAFSVSAIIERKWSDRLNFSYGGMYKLLRSERSAKNGVFDLLKTPLQLTWNGTDNMLDPTKGTTFVGKLIPTLQVASPKFAYCISSFTATYYQSLTKNKRHIFAAKLMVGSIFGGIKNNIPPPERFFAGSETTLRGYRFMTVSPLGRDDKPLGGRSLLVYSLELRNRFKDNLGFVFFYDIGNVYKNNFPDLNKKILQSVGLGLRYYTPVGPVRLDLAVPLNPRKKMRRKKGYFDRPLEAYFSIGQAF